MCLRYYQHLPLVEVSPVFSRPQCSSSSRYRQHNNTHPVTNEPLTPADLIPLHYARKPSGEYHDPISFKPFNEHSHIVAIATTGNVFLAESVKGGVDLLNDVRFKKYVSFRCEVQYHS
jgi:hypothetical protein